MATAGSATAATAAGPVQLAPVRAQASSSPPSVLVAGQCYYANGLLDPFAGDDGGSGGSRR